VQIRYYSNEFRNKHLDAGKIMAENANILLDETDRQILYILGAKRQRNSQKPSAALCVPVFLRRRLPSPNFGVDGYSQTKG
jgi:hypothetical protein